MSDIIPGIMAHSREEYLVKLELVEASTSAWVHVDIMDGRFVPNISVTPSELVGVPTRLNLEAHLMVQDPAAHFSELAMANCQRVLLHREGVADLSALKTLITKAREYIPQVGVVYSPETALEDCRELGVDSIQVMTVVPGESGQSLLPGSFERTAQAVALNPGLIVSVDGGVTEETIKHLAEQGARRFVVSSHIFVGNAVSYNYNYFTSLLTGGA